MSLGEQMYLGLIIAALAVFAATLAYASFTGRRDDDQTKTRQN